MSGRDGAEGAGQDAGESEEAGIGTRPDPGVRRGLGGETPLGTTGAEAVKAEPLRPPLPKRFYRSAEADAGVAPYRVLLDGRPLRTPGKRVLALPTLALAEAIAAEWDAQGAVVDPATMPLTRMANTTLDGVVGNENRIRADIAAYAMSDLVCYRADGPEELARRQAECWDPVARWAAARLGAPLALAAGLMPVAQSEAVRAGVLAALAPVDAFRLTALHVMTTLTGSALVALAVIERRLSAEAAWTAAHVDEDFQASQWGTDAEATLRRAARQAEMLAAARLLGLVD